jgi:hypothetical protein
MINASPTFIEVILGANRQKDGNYPELPKDFWAFLSPKEESDWKQIGSTRSLPEGQKTLTNTEPTILTWQWYVPPQIGNKVGLLVIIESRDDPIQKDNKVLNIEKLAKEERHVGLKTITIID